MSQKHINENCPYAKNQITEKPAPPVLGKCNLWQALTGHTHPVAQLSIVHSGVESALRLLYQLQINYTDETPLDDVITSILALQDRDEQSKTYGCFRWYYEEPHPVDTNAAFFIGLTLIVMRLHYADRLSIQSLESIDKAFAPLYHWFLKETKEFTSVSYPNKYLGDLVCAWLLHEHLNQTDDSFLLNSMHTAADYWHKHHWGWGEHLSDVYSTVMLNQLSVLLLFSCKLPDALRSTYKDLAIALLKIEDAFCGPRVPCIRSYAFESPPEHRPFREYIKIFDTQLHAHIPDSMPRHRFMRPVFGHILAQRGWHRMFPESTSSRDSFEQTRNTEKPFLVPTFGGHNAITQASTGLIIGGISHYPVMSHTDFRTYGLSWQSFPLCILSDQNDWGFLQWHIKDSKRTRAHPAIEKKSAYLGNALTQNLSHPVVGETNCIPCRMGILSMRTMPTISNEWQRLGDRFHLIKQKESTFSPMKIKGAQGIKLEFNTSCLCLYACSLNPESKIAMRDQGRILDWGFDYNHRDLPSTLSLQHIWLFYPKHDITVIAMELSPASDYALAHGSNYERPHNLSISFSDGKTLCYRIAPFTQTPLSRIG